MLVQALHEFSCNGFNVSFKKMGRKLSFTPRKSSGQQKSPSPSKENSGESAKIELQERCDELEHACEDLQRQQSELYLRCQQLQSELDVALQWQAESMAQTQAGRIELARILGEALNMPLYDASKEMQKDLANIDALIESVSSHDKRYSVPELEVFLDAATKSTGHRNSDPALAKKRARIEQLLEEIIQTRNLTVASPISTAAAMVIYDYSTSRAAVDTMASVCGGARYQKVLDLIEEHAKTELELPESWHDHDIIVIFDNNQTIWKTWLNRLNAKRVSVPLLII
jgi:hypothetical protein